MPVKQWFTQADGTLLLWLLLAHIVTDFILQTDAMVKSKQAQQAKAPLLYLHGAIAALTLWLASGLLLPWWLALLAGVLHLVVDYLKIQLDKHRSFAAFIIDQLVHIAVVICLWLYLIHKWPLLFTVLQQLALDYTTVLVLLGYVFVIWPSAIIVRLAIKALLPNRLLPPTNNNLIATVTDDAEKAGRYIGIFERCMIFSLVLLNQYGAIGFLIASKALIRMNSKKQTEYVLLGSLLSYALAIGTGLCIHWVRSVAP
ncbi:DUF3307 domain-containing protein [Parasediminibacterium paludis]|uniref:DUF3307 domain-containing protein n=1 Tax=Parasediminibacterium paludis TaxID=908966 RepID=A0ABV8PUB0_9BACT